MSNLNENRLNEHSSNLEKNEAKNFWHESIRYITFGFMFTLVTFNFLWLQYILPSLGVLFLYIGFRKLRNENKAFYGAYVFSVINLIYNILSLIYVNTPLNVNSKNSSIMAFFLTIFQIIFLILFRNGIRNIINRENIELKKDPILGLIIWRILIIVIAITELGEIWIIFIPTLIYYFYSLKSINKLKYELENISNISSKENGEINKKTFAIFYGVVCLFTVGICCLFSNHTNLESTEIVPVNEFATRNMLIDNGTPIEIVRDIVDEDISLLKNIINIESFSEDLTFEDYSKTTLKATSIFIELEDNEMYGIEYFDFGEDGPYWQDGFAINNTYHLELINGSLLYESEGVDYSARIPRLSGELITSTDIFGQEIQERKITGAINYPRNTKNQRGYVFYKINIPEGTLVGNNIVNYMHYSHPFRVPYTEIEKQNLSFTSKLKQHGGNFTTKLGKSNY